MPKKVSQREMSAVENAVIDGGYSQSLDEISARVPIPISRRTLQRRLAELVGCGELIAVGERGGRKYLRAEEINDLRLKEDPISPKPRKDGAGSLDLSDTSQSIRDNISRLLSMRTPVGYNTDFLEKYRPNKSAYLPIELRKQLHEMGRATSRPLPAGTYFRTVLNRVLIDLSWNSSRLEGNTYSLLETQRLLELGESVDGKNTGETQMLLNHKAAIELLAEPTGGIGFNRYTLCNLHAMLADNLLPDPAACGRLRSHPVGISGTVFRPLEVPQLIALHFDQILEKADAIEDPFEQAFFAMVQLPYLQPFEDVNKRVSRLACNIPLIKHNLGPLSFVDVPQDDYISAILGIYELNRIEFMRDVFLRAYERSCARYAAVRQSIGEPDPFRLQHRALITEVVREVIRSGLDKKAAASLIAQRSRDVPAQERPRFCEVAETELTSLHDGNFARYRATPKEFAAWKASWR